MGFGSAIICIAWNLVIFGFNIMYIVSPLLAGVVESFIAIKKYGKSTGAISALLTFFLINGYGWFGPGWIFPKEPITLSLITLIAIVLTIQAAFPIFVNHLLFVVVPGIFYKLFGFLVGTPSKMTLEPSETEGEEVSKQVDEIFLDELTMPLVSVPDLSGGNIKRYVGLVIGEAIAEENESEGRLSQIMKVIQPTELDDMNLGEARKVALSRMFQNAESMGANAVVEVLIDYVSMGGLQSSATIITATGTAVVIQEETLNLGDKVLEEDSVSVIGEKIDVSGGSEKFSGGGESISEEDEKTNGKESDLVNADDVSNGMGLLLNEETDHLIKDLEFTAKNDFDEELEKRFLNVSRDLEGLDIIYRVDGEKSNRKVNAREDSIKLVHKSDYGEMMIMKIKGEIIGKEVVDVNALVIGSVKDVEVNFETKTLEAFLVGKGGILESLGRSNDIIIPEDMVIAIGDKILVKSEKQSI